MACSHPVQFLFSCCEALWPFFFSFYHKLKLKYHEKVARIITLTLLTFINLLIYLCTLSVITFYISACFPTHPHHGRSNTSLWEKNACGAKPSTNINWSWRVQCMSVYLCNEKGLLNRWSCVFKACNSSIISTELLNPIAAACPIK